MKDDIWQCILQCACMCYRACALPYGRHFHMGQGTFSLWFDEIWLIIHWIPMKTCCILYEPASHTGVRKLCNKQNWHMSTVMSKIGTWLCNEQNWHMSTAMHLCITLKKGCCNLILPVGCLFVILPVITKQKVVKLVLGQSLCLKI